MRLRAPLRAPLDNGIRQAQARLMSAGRIATREELAQGLRKFSGVKPDMIEEFCSFYGRASVAAQRVLPLVQELGFFSSRRERIDAFQWVCRGLDQCVDEEIITQNEATIALFILLFSSDSFAKAMKAFRNYAYGKNLGGSHLASYTAGVYAETCR